MDMGRFFFLNTCKYDFLGNRLKKLRLFFDTKIYLRVETLLFYKNLITFELGLRSLQKCILSYTKALIFY